MMSTLPCPFAGNQRCHFSLRHRRIGCSSRTCHTSRRSWGHTHMMSCNVMEFWTPFQFKPPRSHCTSARRGCTSARSGRSGRARARSGCTSAHSGCTPARSGCASARPGCASRPGGALPCEGAGAAAAVSEPAHVRYYSPDLWRAYVVLREARHMVLDGSSLGSIQSAQHLLEALSPGQAEAVVEQLAELSSCLLG